MVRALRSEGDKTAGAKPRTMGEESASGQRDHQLVTEPAFDACVDVGPPRELGTTPQGRRRIVPILGGTFSGPRLSGRVLPGFDDQFIRSDGVLVVAAYYALEVNDGTIISIVNRGLRHGPTDVIDRIGRGEHVDPALYYFRTVADVSVCAGPHDWLNRSIFIASAERRADMVCLQFFELK